MRILTPFLTAGLAAALLAGCAAPAGLAPPTRLDLSCGTSLAVPAALYVAPYMGIENVIPVKDMAQDIYCSDTIKAAKASAGFVTIYGSSRIREGDPVYTAVKDFAAAWTAKYGKRFPIMTGAGPGIMEAGNRGAQEAGGPSWGYTTYYDRAATPDAVRPYGGDPSKAFNKYVTDGFIFASVATREAAMVKHSAAMVIAPGGTGTEWETYQIVESIKSRQLAKVPVYLIGDRKTHWASLDARLADMAARRTMSMEEVAFMKFVPDDKALLQQLAADMGLN